MTVEERFEEAFIKCLREGVHPGPAEINDRMGRGRNNKLRNGFETKLRKRLMYTFGVPYDRGPYKGRVPEMPDNFIHLSPGFRRNEL